ncbi:MAG: tRNA preQ1(34) S-adenosylmethionine ribosyltransferase-isomerase QueA [Defluviitaleaceae bacterium]|nr:tRNA preQ1(34) S-adenosylmethionine ribosyltransferase-isomerase QueA [Defluviitaleaceae bacterium]
MIKQNKQDFYYDLPERLIAQQPAAQRDGSRLMRLSRKTGQVEHKQFKDIVSLLNPGDCIVINDSKVIPARLIGQSGEAKIEMLLHERLTDGRWSVLAKPGRKAREGDVLVFSGGRLKARVDELIEDGLRIVTLEYEGDFEQLLVEIGEMPLPHYIQEKNDNDDERYQTVYATHSGSVAAPTAGLHFTEELLGELEAKGIKIARVTLHVGIGTFRPVKEDDISKHHMHSEYCRIEPATADLLNETKAAGGRIIAIGTTSCRTLESRVDDTGKIISGAGKTDIFIFPGFEFRAIDGLLTNFHLPESTLIMLVSAMAGREAVLAAYAEAVREEYRFFSYGDAMLIV